MQNILTLNLAKMNSVELNDVIEKLHGIKANRFETDLESLPGSCYFREKPKAAFCVKGIYGDGDTLWDEKLLLRCIVVSLDPNQPDYSEQTRFYDDLVHSCTPISAADFRSYVDAFIDMVRVRTAAGSCGELKDEATYN